MLSWHAAHPGPPDRLADTRRIVGIIFLALHVRFDKLWGHQFHRMAAFAKLPRPVMRTARGFHPNETGRELGDKRQHLLPGETLLHNDVPMGIDTMDAHDVLCDIDAECCN